MTPGAASEEDAIVPLTGKRFFAVVLAKTHVKPTYNLELPVRAQRWFPASVVPITLIRGAKCWKGYYHGNRRFKKFNPSWRDFVHDNNLSLGDACVFELLNPETGEIKVQILRGETELELNELGNTSANPIVLE
ncbi:hypothetical protein H6P81_007293 [Aristolochia fimbriata]|uniref:TF-B3 domain-containing protein n=1 Tax=Aristolochia fimbriata TaxID=158543 RepID=A0AAV7F132_ARIFI|nr:hypothetical protein H6P81_007293 [Aristolochia fimbriata]